MVRFRVRLKVTLHYKLFIVAKVKNCKVHYGASYTTMSGCDCRNKCVFSFRHAVARVWNMLPPAITSLLSLQTFKCALKAELFRRSYDNAH